MMTNEQLVNEIQRGNLEYITALWDNIEHFVLWYAERYLCNYPDHIQALKEDCAQEAYFAVLRAVKRYDDKQGRTFASYLRYDLIQAFRKVIYSGRSTKQEKDPLNSAASFDEPVQTASGEAALLGDFIADDKQWFSDIENADQTRSINDFLKAGLSRSESAGSKILLYMLDNDCRYAEAVRALYGSDTSALQWQKKQAMTRLRRFIVSKPIEAEKYGINEIITQGGLRQYGLQPYKDHQFTSGVERVVIERDKRKHKYS